jgi:PAS domain S-box-containing protein
LDPLDEVERRRLMRLLVLHGNSTSAIREYRDFAQLLQTQLAIEPSLETNRLYRSILELHASPSSAEAGLLESYALALEQLPDGIIVTDLAARIIGFNPAAERSFGWRKQDVVGKTPAILHAQADEASMTEQFMRLALAHGRWTETVHFATHDGDVRRMRRSVVALRSPSGKPIGAFGMSG